MTNTNLNAQANILFLFHFHFIVKNYYIWNSFYWKNWRKEKKQLCSTRIIERIFPFFGFQIMETLSTALVTVLLNRNSSAKLQIAKHVPNRAKMKWEMKFEYYFSFLFFFTNRMQNWHFLMFILMFFPFRLGYKYFLYTSLLIMGNLT